MGGRRGREVMMRMREGEERGRTREGAERGRTREGAERWRMREGEERKRTDEGYKHPYQVNCIPCNCKTVNLTLITLKLSTKGNCEGCETELPNMGIP